jgi:large subunit ribosomal protein L18
MASSKRYALKYRRRREGKTNYKSRLALLKSRKVRAVIRKTNSNTIVQFVEYQPDGDVIIAQATTKELADHGWKASTGNLPAAYLAGLLAGSRAKKAKVSEAIVDFGMQNPNHGGRLFAAVQGILDAEVELPVSEEALPAENRISGEHIDEKLSAQVEAVKKKVQ